MKEAQRHSGIEGKNKKKAVFSFCKRDSLITAIHVEQPIVIGR
jgi:hypothetical protein